MIECKNLSKSFSSFISGEKIEVKALNNINITLESGKIYGVFGVNGSGKSTLLKIISQIYKPETGKVIINGKIASILELGTGFHPDLSGRENIYFNASLLGYSRKEVDFFISDIIEFSELNEYVDQPVKFYSNGMYMRLAFSVVAYLPCNILLLDEVFSVGDPAFRLKCIDKIKEGKKHSKTTLLVSHDLNHINALCDECFLMDRGSIIASGSVNSVMNTYISKFFTDTHLRLANQNDNIWYAQNSNFPIQRVEIKSNKNDFIFMIDEAIEIEVSIIKRKSLPLSIYIVINYGIDVPGITLSPVYSNQNISMEMLADEGHFSLKGIIPAHLLNTGNYILNVIFIDNEGNQLLKIPSFANISVLDNWSNHIEKLNNNKFSGAVLLKTDWSISKFEL